MGLSRAIADARRFITAGGFEQIFTLTSPDGETEVEIKGIEATHHTAVNTEGVPVNSKNTRITVIEADLTDEDITTRDARGDLSMLNWIVEYTDKFGKAKTTKIVEQVPDDTLGILTFWLTDYKK